MSSYFRESGGRRFNVQTFHCQDLRRPEVARQIWTRRKQSINTPRVLNRWDSSPYAPSLAPVDYPHVAWT